MAVTWHKTTFLGVRYREHVRRKHSGRFDRCYSIRYKLSGKDKEEAVGWSSEGVTPESAFNILSEIRDNIRKGVEPQSLASMKRLNEDRLLEEELARRDKEYARITFSKFWETEYLSTAEATKTLRTIQSEKGWYKNWICPAIGDVPLAKITTPMLEAIVTKAIKAGKSPATIRYIVTVISQVWNRAIEYGLVHGDSPTRRVKTPKIDNRRMRFLKEEEARVLLSALAIRSQDIHDIALLSLFCGLRAGEVHSLKWGNLDFENGLIHILDTKTKHNRHAFMTQEIIEMFERRRGIHATTELVFLGANGKERQWVSDTFARTVNALGLNDTGEFIQDASSHQIPKKITDARQRVVFHTLRHTFASWLVKKGTPLYTVAELMGHTNLEMTRRYSHLAPDTLRKEALKLQGQLDAKTQTASSFISHAAMIQ